jgi:uncharacterized Zn-binding protein involved in type VI secretion
MTGAVRLGDFDSGHGCFPSRANISASPDVFVNGKPSHRVGDGWALHGCSVCAPHGGVAASGSPDVFVNGKPKCRVGDAVSCGSSMATGSSDVIVN